MVAAAGESGEESPSAGAGVSERLAAPEGADPAASALAAERPAAEWADADEPPLLTDGGMGA